MNRHLQTSRSAFSHQPAQHLIVDVGYPMTNSILETFIAALQTVLSLACSIRGGNRIPAFALSVLEAYSKCIFRLDIIRGNFGKLEDALNSVNEMVETGNSTEGFNDILLEALQAAIDDFKSKSDNLSGNNLWQFSSQLQITILTTKSGLEIQECLEQAVQTVSTTRLKKIMVVELTFPIAKLSETCSNQNLPFELPKTLGFVEVVRLTAKREVLEDFFKQWLLDYNTDYEHLRIIFPNGVTDMHHMHSLNSLRNQNFVLKCDVSECLINPLALPFGHRFTIHTDFFSFQLGGSMLGKSQGNDLAIYELVVVARLSSGGICESLLFGQPLRLSPTQCWRLEWTKLLINQQSFMALCKELTAKDEFLLTQLKPHIQSDQVSGYFILVPGEGSFLLKAVAPRELVLPDKNVKADRGSPLDDVPNGIQSKITSSLNDLPLFSEYDPQFWKSELCLALTRNLLNNSNPTRVQEKDAKETPKAKVLAPNVIVTDALNKANFRKKGQKRIRSTTNKEMHSPNENSK